MSTIHMYGMLVYGKTDRIEKLASYMKGKEDKRLIGIYQEDTYYGYHEDVGLHVINGGCNSSVEKAMMGTEYSYYDLCEDKTNRTTLEQLTKELDLRLEIDGTDESPHIIIEKGKILKGAG